MNRDCFTTFAMTGIRRKQGGAAALLSPPSQIIDGRHCEGLYPKQSLVELWPRPCGFVIHTGKVSQLLIIWFFCLLPKSVIGSTYFKVSRRIWRLSFLAILSWEVAQEIPFLAILAFPLICELRNLPSFLRKLPRKNKPIMAAIRTIVKRRSFSIIVN